MWYCEAELGQSYDHIYDDLPPFPKDLLCEQRVGVYVGFETGLDEKTGWKSRYNAGEEDQ